MSVLDRFKRGGQERPAARPTAEEGGGGDAAPDAPRRRPVEDWLADSQTTTAGGSRIADDYGQRGTREGEPPSRREPGGDPETAELWSEEPRTRRPEPAAAPDDEVAAVDEPVAPGRESIASAETVRRLRARQREEYGGVSWLCATFGWLVALGLAGLLTGLLTAAGAAIELTRNADRETLGLAGGILLLLVVLLSWYAGGYVAGRMSRFDGGRQGGAVWLLGLLVTLALAALALVAGSEYNVLERFDLPRLPVGREELTTGGAIATAAILLGTLLAAMLGGKAGERYHKRVERAGVDPG